MSILPSKAQVQQKISILGSRESTLSNPIDKVDYQPNTDVFVVQGSAIQSVKRLIVLVPNVDMDEVQIAQKVWEMASPPKLTVLLLSICNNTSEEYRIQRRLITLAALIRDPRVVVEVQIKYGNDWLRGVKSFITDGDVILCHEEQRAGLWHKPLVSLLETFRIPVWTLSGFYRTNLAPRSHWLSMTIFWSGAVALLTGFFYLQVQINGMTDSLAKNVMLCLSIGVEIGLLYAWNSIFS